jgi:hypothetical protein
MLTSSGRGSKSGPLAELRLIEGVHYRRDAFAEGFRKLGFDVVYHSRHVPKKGDVLVLWNRYSRDEMRAREYEASRATVLVTENAWIGPEEKDKHWFALCVGHHNGAGCWRVGSDDRWDGMGIELKPWRERGNCFLILPQRGMGERGVAQPAGWLARTQERTGAMIRIANRNLDTRVRFHPGIRPHPPIDFTGVHGCLTWGSGAAIKALLEGIPVFYELQHWVGATAAVRGFDNLNAPFLGDRLPMFRQLAWAMWRAEEIATGEPLAWLLCKSLSTSTENSEPENTSAPIWRRGSGALVTFPA